MKTMINCCREALRRSVAALFASALSILLLMGPSGAIAAPGTGYWWNTVEPGRGFVIEIQGTTMFMAGFLYDTIGHATWVASTGPMASATQYSGSLTTYSGGQTLTGAYLGPPQAPVTIGTLAINFSSDTTGSLTWPGGTVPIQRFDFGPGGAIAVKPRSNPETGWWWNPFEGGRGYAIEVQGSSMYFASYMYEPSGSPVWYLASGNVASPTLFTGTWSQFANGQTLTGPYKPAIVSNANVGSATLQFSDNHTATLTLPDLRQIPLWRFAFGVPIPSLTAFSPASATPGSLLTISGVGFDAAGEFSVTLTDDLGSYSVTVPPASVSPTAIRIAVPPYVNSASGSFGSRSVNVRVMEKSSGVSMNTNTLNGFTIQDMSLVQGTNGGGTLALVRASLSEAQRLQTAVNGTAQGTPAVLAALAAQVANLQILVTNVQNVVQKGIAFELGVVGGVTLTVTPNNIGDVDRLILATMQSLANPASGSSLKDPAAAGSTCLSTEAAAIVTAMTTGTGNLDQLALNLVQAAGSSSTCNTVANFSSAYQILGGASGGGYGFSNGAGTASLTSRLPGVSLFATAVQTAQPEVGINALISPSLTGQSSQVQNAIVNVATLAKPSTDDFLSKTSGLLVTGLINSQNVLGTVAPPPGGVVNSSLTGTWSGTWSWIQSVDPHCIFNDGGLLSMNLSQSGTTITGTNVAATGFQVRLVSDCSLQYVDTASAGTLTGTFAGTLSFNASLPLVKFGSPFLWTNGSATFNATAGMLTGTFSAYGSTGSFTLFRK